MNGPPRFEVVAGPFDDDRMNADEYAAQYCRCRQPDLWVEIGEGELAWECRFCRKPMNDWFLEMVRMEPVKVSYLIEPGYCTCNMMDQLSCDCDQWPVVKPVLEGETMNDNPEGDTGG